MKVNILNYEPDRIGGGWSAARNLYTAFNSSYESAEVVLITGPTMASHEQVEQAKQDGKKIVLRLDNAVRDSRNRGTGMSRMKAFAEQADLVIYQSEWARSFLEPFLGIGGPVILNGADTSVFNTEGRNASENSYLYVRSSRDEGKNWVGAWYWFIEQHNKNPNSTLDIVGKFSPENMEWGFDFFNGEKFRFLGEQKNMAQIYKQSGSFLYSYIGDCCSNTLIEAKLSGCKIIDVYGALKTGGAQEIMECEDLSVERMVREYSEAING